jgi:hypothetical protein
VSPTPQIDVMAVLASLQEEVERLAATVQAQQRQLDALTEAQRPRSS